MNSRGIFLAVLLCLAAPRSFTQTFQPGQQTKQQSEDQFKDMTGPATIQTGSVVIGPEDSVTIVALDAEEISKTWRVSSTGDLNLPMVGTIHAAGLTPKQLEDKLTEGLKKYIREPQVTVYIANFESQPVTVAGAVHKPGTFQLEGPKTLLSVLMMAYGPDASGPTLVVSRPIESGPIPLPEAKLDSTGQRSTVELRISDVLDPSTPGSNLIIKPNDVISVSSKPRLVYIIGEVARPGAVELVTQDRVSVMQVLAAAGGLTKIASPRHSEIMRVDAQGTYKRVASIDLKQVMTGKSEDRLLTAGDIIVVPSSSLKPLGQVATLGAVSTGLYIITRF